MRYADFKTITRARTLIRSTQLDTVILASIRELFSQNWNEDKAIRLLGVQIGSLETTSGQLDWIDDPRDRKWKQALEATDAVRNRFGESSIGLASAMKNAHQERVHENTVDVPERKLE